MLELPEACVIANQLSDVICGLEVAGVAMNSTPHKFAFYAGDPEAYRDALLGKSVDQSLSYGGMVELRLQNYRLVFSDGVNLRIHNRDHPRPAKHQMLLEFSDGTALSASIQMYGGLWCFEEGTFENPYRAVAIEKPSPLSNAFDQNYFIQMLEMDPLQKLSLKALLATEQRIPGLGNGVLQDLLWFAKLHPKRKVSTLSMSEKNDLFKALKSLLQTMVDQGGRDTEKDLFGNPGGYVARMSKNHAADGCGHCSGPITKEAYLGGSIYFCPSCQRL